MSTRFSRNLYFAVMGKPAPRSPRKAKARRGPARDRAYLDWIRTLPCCACRRTKGIEAAHVGGLKWGGGAKVKCSDYATAPLCWACHRHGPQSFHGLNCSSRLFAAYHCIDFEAKIEALNQAYCVVRGIPFSVFATRVPVQQKERNKKCLLIFTTKPSIQT